MTDLEKKKKPVNKMNPFGEKKKILSPIPIIRALFLALILKNPEITGYEILQIIPEVINSSLKVKTGTVYTELRNLEKLDFVESSQLQKGRKKRQYKLTPAGLEELRSINSQMKIRIKFLLEPLIEFVDSTLVDLE